jgi:sensor histidine kinase YesM
MTIKKFEDSSPSSFELYKTALFDVGRVKIYAIYALMIGLLMGTISSIFHGLSVRVYLFAILDSFLITFTFYSVDCHKSWLYKKGKTYKKKAIHVLMFTAFLSVTFSLINFYYTIMISNNLCGFQNHDKVFLERSWWEGFLTVFVISGIFGAGASAYERIRSRLLAAGEVLKQKELSEQELLRLKTEAELQALQAQINPHFLFNTLNSIVSLIQNSPDKAEEAVIMLSKMFRMTLRHSGKGESRPVLRASIDQVKIYLELEKLRFSERLNYKIDVDEKMLEMAMPSLLIQPLVENSVKHGISPKLEGGTIEVIGRIKEYYCEIVVKDDGLGKSASIETQGEGHGLTSIRERLSLFYGDNFNMTIHTEEGFEVSIQIPNTEVGIRKGEDND